MTRLHPLSEEALVLDHRVGRSSLALLGVRLSSSLKGRRWVYRRSSSDRVNRRSCSDRVGCQISLNRVDPRSCSGRVDRQISLDREDRRSCSDRVGRRTSSGLEGQNATGLREPILLPPRLRTWHRSEGRSGRFL